MQDARVRTLEETIVVPGQRGWWRLAWNCIIRLGTSRISMSCIFHEARSRGGNHIAFGSPDAVPSAFSPSPFSPSWQTNDLPSLTLSPPRYSFVNPFVTGYSLSPVHAAANFFTRICICTYICSFDETFNRPF